MPSLLVRMNRAGRIWGKIPYSNSHLNSNPNPNSKKKQKQFHNSSSNGGGPYNDDFPSATQAASDDAYSFNQTSASASSGFNHGGYLTYNLASYTKSELLELRKRLAAELEQIQNLRNQIDSGQFNFTSTNNNPGPQGKVKKLSGNKRPGVPVGSNKDPKNLCNGFLDSGNLGVVSAIDCEAMLKECRQILTKLMKHKNGWIFNKPVDAAALGLHDYHLIVKQPMDLGTVKSNLAKNLYSHPAEFAADVRLTFNNALLYNPKTDQVNGIAEQLLVRFEELFRPILEKFDRNNTQRKERELREFWDNDELQGSQWTDRKQIMASSPGRGGKKSKPTSSLIPAPRASKKPMKLERMQVKNISSSLVPPVPPPPSSSPPVHAQTPSPVSVPLPSKEEKDGRVGTVKQPKPRAKDLNKRAMSVEEKHKLGNGLQSLPQEKMPQLVQIVRKRNAHLGQDGDEIELDIEALDTETLWELDRFVTNWKKMVSKTKRQALMMNNNPTAPTTNNAEDDMGELSEGNDMGKKPKKNEDEDVDIDDDMPVTSFPPVEIEKDEGGGGGGGGHDQGNANSSSSSSSSSSSDSSSSSGSDSGSSSSSDSDADDAQS
ncbi:transcription factor GTE7-like [Olea europaea subsp. europaea]|uniref:Transcription factor GTE7-like n=1 Tax=Olea europaea subsp. europaea TaxID=158383 RepID=A0A8S0Q3G4_OLEEU|nr:transcription factor GTE7-like [Olea europaea subsp. europaea]